ncbi:hypothetical protein BDM02DRAFT_586099 [Thelephora ganbajun]|uniref:Uncharacterized protein n=1 Tax=Thelephora ganbajun TaxID=370292 RepID=A0ACB6Z6X1_THEGA|nr:hypothetical protein BDM02DRAFT_586099 [Thelephora ganbajun]
MVGRRLTHTSSSFSRVSPLSTKDSFSSFSLLMRYSDALKVLHPNILVTDQHHARLVDFNWYRKAGETEYPANTNLLDIKWPEGGFTKVL